MASIKAPKGGTISVVNGQFYEGGEFMPDHGLYCGKGKNRVAVPEFDAMAARLMASRGWDLRYNEAREVFQAVLPTGNVMYASKSIKVFATFCS